MWEVWLGPRRVESRRRTTDLPGMMAQSVGGVFALMERLPALWFDVPRAAPRARRTGDPPSLARRWSRGRRRPAGRGFPARGARPDADLGVGAGPGDPGRRAQPATPATSATFRFPDDVWARVDLRRRPRPSLLGPSPRAPAAGAGAALPGSNGGLHPGHARPASAAEDAGAARGGRGGLRDGRSPTCGIAGDEPAAAGRRLVQGRHLLRGPRQGLHGRQRRRDRRLRRSHRPARLPARSGGRLPVAPAHVRLAPARRRLRHRRLLHLHPSYGTVAEFRTLLDGRPRARPPGHRRSGHEPHLRSAPVVPGLPELGDLALRRLLRVERDRPALPRRAHHLRRHREVQLDVGCRAAAPTTGTASSATSRTSTTTTPPSARPC